MSLLTPCASAVASGDRLTVGATRWNPRAGVRGGTPFAMVFAPGGAPPPPPTRPRAGGPRCDLRAHRRGRQRADGLCKGGKKSLDGRSQPSAAQVPPVTIVSVLPQAGPHQHPSRRSVQLARPARPARTRRSVAKRHGVAVFRSIRSAYHDFVLALGTP